MVSPTIITLCLTKYQSDVALRFDTEAMNLESEGMDTFWPRLNFPLALGFKEVGQVVRETFAFGLRRK